MHFSALSTKQETVGAQVALLCLCFFCSRGIQRLSASKDYSMFTLPSLLALPVVLVIFAPLIFSASITISFALVILFLRLFVIYTELGYALIVHFLSNLISNPSLPTLSASDSTISTTGNSRQKPAYDLIQSRIDNDSSSAWPLGEFQEDQFRSQMRNYARSMVEAHYLPSSPLSGFPISGDERRDFEGVGGWRSCPSSKRRDSDSHLNALSNPSSSSVQSAIGTVNIGSDLDIDDDERAWLLLNHRLELPSQLVTLGAASTKSSTVHDPINLDSFNYHDAIRHRQIKGRRHHYRSHTTSSLIKTNSRSGNGLSLALSTRPTRISFLKPEGGLPLSTSVPRLASFLTSQSYSHTYTRTRPLTRAASPPTGVPLFHSVECLTSSWAEDSTSAASSGYFTLYRPADLNSSSLSARASPSPSGFSTPDIQGLCEQRCLSSSRLARLMAHPPTSVRHRRRSIAGPHPHASGGDFLC